MSDKALRCPHCGEPNDALQTNQTNNIAANPTSKSKKKSLLWLSAVVVVFLIAGGITWWLLSGDRNVSKDATVEITPQFIEAVHQYDELYPFSEGLAAVKKDGKYGFINTKGELVIPIQFFGVGGFSEGLACVYDDQYKASFIDYTGKVIINTTYDLRLGYVNPNLVSENHYLLDMPVFRNGFCEIIGTNPDNPCEYKWIDKKGNEVSEPTENTSEITNDYIVFSKEREDGETFYGLKDKDGKEIIAPIYSYLSLPSNGVANARITEYRYFNNRSEQLDAQENGETTTCSIYGYVDLKGVSTFQQKDYQKIEKFSAEQKQKASDARYAEYQRQREAEIEEYRRQQAQDIEWVYGTWACHVLINDPYLGRLESNNKLIISPNSLQVYNNGRLEYNGGYEVEGGQIKYDRKNGSCLVIPIDYSSKRLEAGEGNYYTKISGTSQTTPTQANSSGNVYQSGQRRYIPPQPFHSELDVKRYLTEHRFAYQNNVVKFGSNSVYINGYAQTSAPRITNFSGYRATIVAGSVVFHLDAEKGTVTDGQTVFRVK